MKAPFRQLRLAFDEGTEEPVALLSGFGTQRTGPAGDPHARQDLPETIVRRVEGQQVDSGIAYGATTDGRGCLT